MINWSCLLVDTKVKGILSHSATKFTEWLIQQGLVRSEQVCTNHSNGEVETNKKLKLGMYSDANKFPYSGGYIWISDCCPTKFVSVKHILRGYTSSRDIL